MVRLFAIVLAIAAVHGVAATMDRCLSYELRPTTGMCAGKIMTNRVCAALPDGTTDAQIEAMKPTLLAASLASMNAKTLETYAADSCGNSASRDSSCDTISSGATGTDACGAMGCVGANMCFTGLNPPRSCFVLVPTLGALFSKPS
jgi:hypothetical protein